MLTPSRLAQIEQRLEQQAAWIADRPSNRYALVTAASTLLLTVELCDQTVDQLGESGAAEIGEVRASFARVRETVRWVQAHGQDAPEGELRQRVLAANLETIHALSLLRRLLAGRQL